MTRASTFILIAYAMTMLSYGALEMGHDLLHYLDAHSRLHVHHHEHGHNHSYSDHHHHHHHEVHAHSHAPEPATAELPSLVSFFLYAQSTDQHTFLRKLLERITTERADMPPAVYFLPSVPPPKYLLAQGYNLCLYGRQFHNWRRF